MTKPTIAPLPPATVDEVRALLDRFRTRHGLTSDEQVAQLLGVSTQAIYRWRHGEIGRGARALVTMARELVPNSDSLTDENVDLAA